MHSHTVDVDLMLLHKFSQPVKAFSCINGLHGQGAVVASTPLDI